MGEQLRLLQGDITQQQVAAIVNAANEGLLGGGGVDGAIHRAGGPEIKAACDRIRAEKEGRPCPTGTAVLTTAGRLRASAVIHTAGPRWHGGGSGEASLLASCYRSCLELACEHGLRSIAFPSISTGVYGYPIEQAAEVALRSVAAFLANEPEAFDEIRFVLFSKADYQIYERTLIGLSL